MKASNTSLKAGSNIRYLKKCSSLPTENTQSPYKDQQVNPLNAELNPVCHLLALLGAHHTFHVSGLREC